MASQHYHESPRDSATTAPSCPVCYEEGSEEVAEWCPFHPMICLACCMEMLQRKMNTCPVCRRPWNHPVPLSILAPPSSDEHVETDGGSDLESDFESDGERDLESDDESDDERYNYPLYPPERMLYDCINWRIFPS
jgi:hypothetical protein